MSSSIQNPGPSKIPCYGIWCVFALTIMLLPFFFTSRFSISLFSQIGISCVFALSYNMLLGQGGMLSFGHAVFMGLGGFIAVHALNLISENTLPVPLELLPLIGGLGGAFFGSIFGYLCCRREGTPFALITLGIVELFASGALMFPSFFGGEEGVSGNRMIKNTLTGFDFGSEIEVYFLIGSWTFLCVLCMYLQTQTPLGRLANAVRDNPIRASFIGYNPSHVRFLQFVLSGFFAGTAGGLFIIRYEIIAYDALGLVPSGNVLFMTYIGGVGHFMGPILGAILISILQLVLIHYTEAWQLYFGLLFMAMVLWAPGGLSWLLIVHQPVWKAGLMSKLLPSYLQALATGLIFFLGLIIFIEINYHLSLSIEPGAPLELFGLVMDGHSVVPWSTAISCLILGLWLFRHSVKMVAAQWDAVMVIITKKTLER
ncbi:MAG: branched-chain amino acid ABC transporter permease [SAR324 cluster bacterium]|nr:branched-chain amino acid ABC transporter permease [SAR324 cluster bacterium]